MNFDVIKALGIESEDKQEILSQLENMQSDLLEQIEYVDDDERSEIEKKLDTIKEQYDLVKRSLQEDSDVKKEEKPEPRRNIPIAVPAADKDTEKKEKTPVDLKKEEKQKENHEKELRAQADKLKKDNLKNRNEDNNLFKQYGNSSNSAVKSTDSAAKSESNAATIGSTASSASTDSDSDIIKGLSAYVKKDYKNAFSILSGAVNDPKNAVDAGLPYAEFVLGHMFAVGEGTNKDDERAAFWFEKAAQKKEPHACLEMGIRWAGKTPQTVAEDTEIIRNSLKYLEMAAEAASKDSGLVEVYKNSMSVFVTVCEKKNPGYSQIRKACAYLGKLEELESDAYLKDQIRKRKETLLKAKKQKTKAARSNDKVFCGWNDTAIIFSKFLFIIGAMVISYALVKKVNGCVTDSVWAFPWLDEYTYAEQNLFIRFPLLINNMFDDVFYRAIRNEGMFGVSFFCIGSLIRSLSDRNQQGSFTRIVSTILSFAPLFIMGMCLITVVFEIGIGAPGGIEGGEMLAAIGLAVGCIGLAYIPGKIFRFFFVY